MYLMHGVREELSQRGFMKTSCLSGYDSVKLFCKKPVFCDKTVLVVAERQILLLFKQAAMENTFIYFGIIPEALVQNGFFIAGHHRPALSYADPAYRIRPDLHRIIIA